MTRPSSFVRRTLRTTNVLSRPSPALAEPPVFASTGRSSGDEGLLRSFRRVGLPRSIRLGCRSSPDRTSSEAAGRLALDDSAGLLPAGGRDDNQTTKITRAT